jgi:hypothetical protein
MELRSRKDISNGHCHQIGGPDAAQASGMFARRVTTSSEAL